MKCRLSKKSMKRSSWIMLLNFQDAWWLFKWVQFLFSFFHDTYFLANGITCFNMISIFKGHTFFSWVNLYIGKNYHSRHKQFLPIVRNEAVDQWGGNKNLCYFVVNCWWCSFFETLMIIFQYAIHLTPESTGNSARLLFHHHLSLF